MKKINIPIHRHTKVRRPMSRWFLQLVSDVGLHNTGVNYPLITDLQRVPKEKSIALDFGYFNDCGVMAEAFRDHIEEGNKLLSNSGLSLFRDIGKETIPTKKLGIFQNIWQNKIKKWWKENYNRKDKENSRAVEATIPSKWDKL